MKVETCIIFPVKIYPSFSSFFFFLYERKQMITLFPTLPSEKQGKEYLCRTHTTGLQGGFPA